MESNETRVTPYNEDKFKEWCKVLDVTKLAIQEKFPDEAYALNVHLDQIKEYLEEVISSPNDRVVAAKDGSLASLLSNIGISQVEKKEEDRPLDPRFKFLRNANKNTDITEGAVVYNPLKPHKGLKGS